MASKTEKRAKEILHLLLHSGKTSVEELTSRFATSPASIRRDLARLEEQGLVHRTHGGAMLAGHAGQLLYEPFRFDASFKEREGRFTREKQQIGLAAVELVGERETVGITAGTTTTQVARVLANRTGIRVMTNALNIAMELSGIDGLEVDLTGGCIRWAGAFSLTGPIALETVQNAVFDTLFLGVTGMHPQFGATTIQAEEALLFRAMARRAKRVVVVCDSSKIGMVSQSVIFQVSQINVLVTDQGISDEDVMAFQQLGIRTLTAG